MNSKKEWIIHLIEEEWPTAIIKLEDLSHLHQGHLGPQKNKETHFYLLIEELSLKKLSLIDQHRQIKNKLKPVFDEGLHSLKIKVK